MSKTTKNEREKNAFFELTKLVNEYSDNRLTFDTKKLQNMREAISLSLFYLSSDYAMAVSRFDAADWNRKRNYAELIEKHRFDEEGHKNTVVVSESLARIENKPFEEEVVESIRQKERAKLIVNSTTQILHAISSRLNSIQK